MDPNWQSPEAWQKDGSSLSGVSSVKKGAWTTILKATETHDGKSTEVVIKTFAVPEEVLENPERIATERTKFLASAKLQYELSKAGATAWVKILRIADEEKHPSFSMEKCGPSAQDLLDNHAQLSAKDFYQLVQSVLQALIELKNKNNRSHGNIKLSDVLSVLPGQHPAFKLADPSSKGENHSANDLFALGQIIFQLVEQREYDPLNPLLPTKPWYRFGARRDRWIQFCNLLLNPNGCQEPLPEVKKLAQRLQPASAMSYVALVGTALVVVAACAVGFHFVMEKYVSGKGGTVSGGPSGTGPANVLPLQTGLDPQAQAALNAAARNYQDVRNKWTAIAQTPRYDHMKSHALAVQARDLLPQPGGDPVSHAHDADSYRLAALKLQEAIDQLNAEEDAGQQADAMVFTDLQHAKLDYARAKSAWDVAAAKFTPNHDHTRSQAQAQAATLESTPTPADPAEAKAATAEYHAAAGKLADALALVSQEDQSGQTSDEAHAAYEQARRTYTQLKDQFAAAVEQNKTLDLTAAKSAADQARAILPEQIVLTDAASYRTVAGLYQQASVKIQAALGLIDQQKQNVTRAQSDISAAVANANQALTDKKYADALMWYKKAADGGSAPAMRNVGLLYETGRGTEQDYAAAADWYKKAADLGNPGAMFDLANLYEKGWGVDQDFAQAATWYRKAADAKNASAMNHLAYLYESGRGVDQDYDQAMQWYKKAADANDSTAMANIGVLYDKGRGVKADPAAAMQWYRKAADLGNAAAMNDIGLLYDAGRGVKADPQQAMEWYQKSADANFAPAMCNIGVLYDNGVGVKEDHVAAMKWFKKAAALNHGLAMFNVAFLYEAGRGTPADIVQAVQWYRRAYKSDDDSARQLAGEALDRLGYSRESTPPRH
jgi:TPR repeat protein